jgi:adenosylmethionine-8-amino-7-oxononanoate aminotransferase
MLAEPRNNPGRSNREWIARDLAVLWHPCTQMHDHERALPLIPVRSAIGAWITDIAIRASWPR